MKTIEQIVDRAGDWNPQIFRELKERINIRNVSLAAVGSFLVQGLTWLSFEGQIPTPTYDYLKKLVPAYSRYCETVKYSPNNYYSGQCAINGGSYTIKWDLWWGDLYIQLGALMTIGLILGIVYTLVADLSKEEKRGTLNFIRLSPQSPQTIFSGKLLGVPILVYIAFGLAIPFHLWAGLSAGAGFSLALVGELTILAMAWFWGCAAMLYSLLGGFQAIVTTLAVAYFAAMPIFLLSQFTAATLNGDEWLKQSQFSWYFLPIFRSALFLDLFVAGSCAIAGMLFWQAIARRYLNPTATIVTKIESYISTVAIQIWLLGFVLPSLSMPYYDRNGIVSICAAVDFILLALFIPLLLPSRQSMIDWSRFRRQRLNERGKMPLPIKDLLINDRAPALLTIALNLLIAVAMWSIVFMVTNSKQSEMTRFFACLCIAATMISVYGAIVHLIQFFKLKKRRVWTIGSILTATCFPTIMSIVLTGGSTPKGIGAIVMLFSPFFPAAVFNLPGMTILATCLAQMAIFGGMNIVLQRKLNQVGMSESKAAFQGS
jgi:hypothetical protein